GDKGFLPEAELHVEGRDYDVGRVKAMADRAASLVGSPPADGLKDADWAVRYWAALGVVRAGRRRGLLAGDAPASVRAAAWRGWRWMGRGWWRGLAGYPGMCGSYEGRWRSWRLRIVSTM